MREAQLQNKLDEALEREKAALEQVRIAQRNTAKHMKAEGVARDALNAALAGAATTPSSDTTKMEDQEKKYNELLGQYGHLEKQYSDTLGKLDGYDHLEKSYTEALGELKKQGKTIKELQDALTTVNTDKSELKRRLTDADVEKDGLAQEIKDLQQRTDELKDEVSYQKRLVETTDRTLNHAYADHDSTKQNRDEIILAKDKLEAENLDWKLQFESLQEQWQEDQVKLEKVEEYQADLEKLERESRNLAEELEELQALHNGHERTVIVKDERIAHLENQVQKERQRNLDAAHAYAADAVTSPVDEEAPPFSTLSDSLETELDALSDDEYEQIEHVEHETEHLEICDTIEMANIAPVEPARPAFAIDVREAASTQPVSAPVPGLTIAVNEAGSVTPVERHSSTASQGIQTDEDEEAPPVVLDCSTVEHIDAFASSPIEPAAAPPLTIKHPRAYFEIPPTAPLVVATKETSTQTKPAELTTNIANHAPIVIAPVQARAQKLTTRAIEETLAISPIEPAGTEAQELSAHMIDEAGLDTEREQKPMSSLADVKITMKEEPIEAKPKPATDTPTVVVTPKHNKISFLQAILPVVCLLLAISCLSLYIQLDGYRHANGIGYRYSNSGRNVFDDIGETWWEEQIARFMSRGIKRLHSWAGIDSRPLY